MRQSSLSSILRKTTARQVKLDVDFEKGMGISVGRLREDTVYDYKFVGLSHNTVRGAAGGAVLCAETLTAKIYQGKIERKREKGNRSFAEPLFSLSGGVWGRVWK